MKDIRNSLRAAALAVAALVAMLVPEGAPAQVVTQLPVFISPNPGVITDFGNGPLELKAVQGNAMIGTSQGSGVGSTSGSSTTLTLTATPAVAPCVGCIISGLAVSSGTTVAAFNGTTTITLSAAMTVAASTPLAWGAACPTPPLALSFLALPLQSGVTPDLPLYTQARVCGYAQNASGAAVLPFPIGAH